ncbi:MAG TPA: hypothetical protein VJK02_22310 [Anaerolineales bacterium]|jgi:hypothetical protein|nr:hypothetical protein [Anaerolineales bacterium]
MSLPDTHAILNGLVLLAGALIALFVARAALHLTAKLARIGCVAIVVVTAVGFLASRLT